MSALFPGYVKYLEVRRRIRLRKNARVPSRVVATGAVLLAWADYLARRRRQLLGKADAEHWVTIAGHPVMIGGDAQYAERQKQVEDLAHAMGFKGNVYYDPTAGPSFDVGDHHGLEEAAHYTPRTNEITVHAGAFGDDPETLDGIMAHEVEHAKFQVWTTEVDREMRAAHDEDDRIRMGLPGGRDPEPHQSPVGVDGLLRPEAAAQYPAAWASQEIRGGPPHEYGTDGMRALAEEDGVSHYSMDYWDAWSNTHDAIAMRLATNETLAEMARGARTGAPLSTDLIRGAHPRFARLYDAVNATYDRWLGRAAARAAE